MLPVYMWITQHRAKIGLWRSATAAKFVGISRITGAEGECRQETTGGSQKLIWGWRRVARTPSPRRSPCPIGAAVAIPANADVVRSARGLRAAPQGRSGPGWRRNDRGRRRSACEDGRHGVFCAGVVSRYPPDEAPAASGRCARCRGCRAPDARGGGSAAIRRAATPDA